MGKKEVIEVLVEGGNARPTPPLGPALSRLKLPIQEVINKINEKTKDFKGLQVPVKIIVDVDTKQYEIEVGTPPTPQLIKMFVKWKEVRKNKKGRIIAARTPWNPEVVGDIDIKDVIKIAKMKMNEMNTCDLKKAVKCILGTLVSMGITVNGKHPKEVQKEIDEGKYDDLLKQAL